MLSDEILNTKPLRCCLSVLLTVSSAPLRVLAPTTYTSNVNIQLTVLFIIIFGPTDYFEPTNSNRLKPSEQFPQKWPELLSGFYQSSVTILNFPKNHFAIKIERVSEKTLNIPHSSLLTLRTKYFRRFLTMCPNVMLVKKR